MGQIEEEERGRYIHSPSPTCQGAQDDSKTSTDTDPMEELQQQQWLMRSGTNVWMSGTNSKAAAWCMPTP